MLTRLGLRLRIFLFFCLLGLGGAALAACSLWLGWSRADPPLPAAPFITAFAAFAFANTALALGIWLLFDENVAKPINALSADLRLRAHSGVKRALDPAAARYLGDLAPAARALTASVGDTLIEQASGITGETERLNRERERLTALLTEIPIATILVNDSQEIVLYDAQAADVMARIGAPRLRAPLSDYFDTGPILNAIGLAETDPGEVPFTLRDPARSLHFEARLKKLERGGHMIFIEAGSQRRTGVAPRPLVFDFDLMNRETAARFEDSALGDLCFVPFDTETTGLSVEHDEIVQIGAVRVLNGRRVAGEQIDMYVDPGRPIPPASSRIHGITDADVAGAPGIAEAGRALHHFARDAVLVAHNAPFDIGLLRRRAADMGVEWSHPVLDTVLLSAVVFGTNAEHSLDALCSRLDVTIPPELRHAALGDAQATAEALVRLLPLLHGRGLTTFGALVAETRKHGRLLKDLNV